MKTTSVPLVGDCPPWDARIPVDRLSEFKALLNQVQQEILASAGTGLIGDDVVRRWHRTLFHPFVPLGYYAGNFRQAVPGRPCLQADVEVGGVSGWPWQTAAESTRRLFQAVFADLTETEIRWQYLAERDRVLAVARLVTNLVGGFVRIHPFLNGNGRVSRLLWRWMLYRFDVPAQSTVFPRPAAPYEQLMSSAMRGDYHPLAVAVIAHLAAHKPRQT